MIILAAIGLFTLGALTSAFINVIRGKDPAMIGSGLAAMFSGTMFYFLMHQI